MRRPDIEKIKTRLNTTRKLERAQRETIQEFGEASNVVDRQGCASADDVESLLSYIAEIERRAEELAMGAISLERYPTLHKRIVIGKAREFLAWRRGQNGN